MKLINPRTGKEYRGLAVPSKQKFPEPVSYVAVFEHGLKYLAKLKINATEVAVLFEMLARMDYENWIRVSQKTLAKELGIHQPTVSRAIGKLVKIGVILRESEPSDEEKLVYRLNPSLGWRGEPKEWLEILGSREQEPIPPCFVREK